jgi:predicted metalloenzyme YecM
MLYMTTNNVDFAFSPAVMRQEIVWFKDKIEQLYHLIGLAEHGLELDHVAMRINHVSCAQQAEIAWSKQGKVLSKAEINGRPIVVLEMDTPIEIGKWTVDCVELPYPAEGKIYPVQGWEHVEFVVPCLATVTTLEQFVLAVRTRFPEMNRCWDQFSAWGIEIKCSEPKASGERLANPTLAFKWKGVTIKLHPHALKTVIQSEQSPLP